MMTRMKELEDENRRLKKMYLEEKLKTEIVNEVVQQRGLAIRVACAVFSIILGGGCQGRAWRP